MDYILQKFVLYPELADPRIKDWPVPESTLPVIVLVVAYLLFSTKFGPKFMKHRKPFNVMTLIRCYNFAQIIYNLYLALEMIAARSHFSPSCIELKVTEEYPHNVGIRIAVLYWYNKVFDLLDTVFIVARKKFRQITFLHLYHHSLMAFGTYFGARFMPGGHNGWVVLFNSIVHVAMYTYYLITTYDRTKTMWWKRYITILQLIQFALGGLVFGLTYFDTTCTFNKQFALLMLFLDSIWVYLFGKFYYYEYIKKEKST